MDVTKALELYGQAKGYWSEIYTAAREDVRFSIGLDHYTDDEIKRRGKDGCMIVPILPQFIHQVMNDMRQNTPSINVLPGEGEGADPETAKIFKGLIRNIEYKSKADAVYDTASEYSVRGGFGYARVDHNYVSEDSFLQELKLCRVHNPQSVYLDPRYTECDGSDAEWGIVLDTISKKDFEEKYPGKQFTSFDDKPTDKKAEEITIAELFVKEYTNIEKQMSADGKISDYTEEDEKKEKNKRRRTLRKVKIGRYKFSGAEELERTTFPGKYIPIVPFLGEEVWDNGKRNLLSLIRLAKDAQRRVNKWASKESEILDMAPISPVEAPFGSVDDFMNEWGSPGEVNVMRYRMFDDQGRPLNKPERLNPPPIPTGIINAMQGAKENVKEALGMYNASIGQKSNAISGVAYDAQKLEADVATFHFPDNRNRAIEQLGRILVCAIPEIYDTDRIIQIIGEEETPQLVGVNGAAKQNGQEQDYDLTKGMYDVRVTTGASYTTKRQEAAALFGDVIKTTPQLIGVIGDLWAKNLDVAGADAMAARIRKTIPKELTADEDAKENGEQAPDPEKIQMAQIIQQLQAQLQQVAGELENKQGEQQIKQGELLIKQQELRIKEAELQLKAAQDNAPPNNALDVEKQAFEQSVKERELALKEAEFQLKVMQAKQAQPELIPEEKTPEQQEAEQQEMEMLAMQQAEEKAREEQESAIKIQQTNAVIEALTAITQQLASLSQQVSEPKKVIRDPQTGLIAGVQ